MHFDALGHQQGHPHASSGGVAGQINERLARASELFGTQVSDPTPVSDEPLQTPELLREDYRFLRLLGAGAQAKSYLAERLSDQLQVVIKVMHLHQVDSWKALELFEREAELLARLQLARIPRLLETRRCEQPSPSFYSIFEYIEGDSGVELLKQHSFDEEEIFSLLSDLCELLEGLQRAQPPLFHRDIKPSNILRNRDGRWCLIDFGAASIKGEGSTVAGTFGYMAPEQFQGRAGMATDLYGLGATALHLYSGREPASFPSRALRLEFRSELQMSERLGALLEALLEPDESMRPASAAALRTLLDGATQEALLEPVSRRDCLCSLDEAETQRAFAQLTAAPRSIPRGYRVPVFKKLVIYAGAGFLLIALALGSVLSLLGFSPYEVMLMMLFPLIMIPSLLRTRRRVSRLLRQGQKARGRVRRIQVRKDGTLVEYTFGLPDGRSVEGRAMLSGCDVALSVGDPVGVLYHPERVEQSMLYPVPKAALPTLFDTDG